MSNGTTLLNLEGWLKKIARTDQSKHDRKDEQNFKNQKHEKQEDRTDWSSSEQIIS